MFLRPEVVANAADGSLQEPTVVSRATPGFSSHYSPH